MTVALRRYVRRHFAWLSPSDAESLFQALNLTEMIFLYKRLSDDERGAFLAHIGAVESKFDWRDAQLPDGYGFERLSDGEDSAELAEFLSRTVPLGLQRKDPRKRFWAIHDLPERWKTGRAYGALRRFAMRIGGRG